MLVCKYVGWIYWNMVIWLHLLRTHQTFLLKKEKNQQTDKRYKVRKFLLFSTFTSWIQRPKFQIVQFEN
jgi:hypothetical protein